jgi:hypothetical protein
MCRCRITNPHQLRKLAQRYRERAASELDADLARTLGEIADELGGEASRLEKADGQGAFGH